MSDDLLVRNLGADVKQRLRARAAAHGRSLVAEAREILTAASAAAERPQEGLGTRIARRFAVIGLRKGELEPLPFEAP